MITYKLKINLQDSRLLTSDMEFVSGDVGAYRLEFMFYDNGKPLDLLGKLLTVKAKRADGVILSDSGTVSEHKAVFVLKNDIYAVAGELYLEVALMDSLKNYVTTKILLANVIDGLGETSEIADNNASVYVTLLGQMKSQLDAANALLVETNQMQEETATVAKAVTESAAAASESAQNAAKSEKAALAAAENAEKSARAAAVSAESTKHIPEVTSEDNGKILRVVDGVWSAETLINAEEVSY